MLYVHCLTFAGNAMNTARRFLYKTLSTTCTQGRKNPDTDTMGDSAPCYCIRGAAETWSDWGMASAATGRPARVTLLETGAATGRAGRGLGAVL